MSPWIPEQRTGEQNKLDHMVMKRYMAHPSSNFVYSFEKEVLNRSYLLAGKGEGSLPNLTYIIRKPEPLVACPQTGMMLSLEIQHGKAEMTKKELYKKLRATTSCVA